MDKPQSPDGQASPRDEHRFDLSGPAAARKSLRGIERLRAYAEEYRKQLRVCAVWKLCAAFRDGRQYYRYDHVENDIKEVTSLRTRGRIRNVILPNLELVVAKSAAIQRIVEATPGFDWDLSLERAMAHQICLEEWGSQQDWPSMRKVITRQLLTYNECYRHWYFDPSIEGYTAFRALRPESPVVFSARQGLYRSLSRIPYYDGSFLDVVGGPVGGYRTDVEHPDVVCVLPGVEHFHDADRFFTRKVQTVARGAQMWGSGLADEIEPLADAPTSDDGSWTDLGDDPYLENLRDEALAYEELTYWQRGVEGWRCAVYAKARKSKNAEPDTPTEFILLNTEQFAKFPLRRSGWLRDELFHRDGSYHNHSVVFHTIDSQTVINKLRGQALIGAFRASKPVFMFGDSGKMVENETEILLKYSASLTDTTTPAVSHFPSPAEELFKIIQLEEDHINRVMIVHDVMRGVTHGVTSGRGVRELVSQQDIVPTALADMVTRNTVQMASEMIEAAPDLFPVPVLLGLMGGDPHKVALVTNEAWRAISRVRERDSSMLPQDMTQRVELIGQLAPYMKDKKLARQMMALSGFASSDIEAMSPDENDAARHADFEQSVVKSGAAKIDPATGVVWLDGEPLVQDWQPHGDLIELNNQFRLSDRYRIGWKDAPQARQLLDAVVKNHVAYLMAAQAPSAPAVAPGALDGTGTMAQPAEEETPATTVAA